jgi:hypothetical protein
MDRYDFYIIKSNVRPWAMQYNNSGNLVAEPHIPHSTLS